jgi:replicative DNA helicase
LGEKARSGTIYLGISVALAESNRSLPHSVEAERAVLAGMLHDSDALLVGLEQLREANALWKKEVAGKRRQKSKEPVATLFFHTPYQLLFDLVSDLEAEGKNASFVALLEAAKKKKVLDQIGGAATLMEVLESAATGTNVPQYADIVKEKFLLRRLILTASDLVGKAYEDSEGSDSLITEAEDALQTLSQSRQERSFIKIGDALQEVHDALMEAYNKKGMVTGVQTYFTLLDEMTSGLQPSDLIILAARPSIGKTAFALNVMKNVATAAEPLPVALFSLEMSITQIIQRLLCLMAQVDLKRLRSGHLSKKESSRVFTNLARMAPLPIFVDDSPGLTISSVRARAKRLKARVPGLSLIVVDYMQLMEAGSSNRQRNRQEEVSAISRGLKELARELNVPVMALSQLSRGVEHRESGIPRLSDLRESGAIEQDADVVLFLHRKKPRDSEDPDQQDVSAEIIIGKQRNGPVGNIPIAFIPNYAMFNNLATFEAPPDAGLEEDYVEDYGLEDGTPF